MIFRASALVCIVSASTKFWMRWWGITRGSSSRVGPSERMRESEREALKEEKRKKISCPLFSLSLSSFFFFSLFLSLFLSFFLSKKMRRRDFLVFLTPFVWKKKRAGSYRRIKEENYNIFARTETSKRKRKEQKTSDVEKRRAFVRFVGSYATCATLTRRQSSFCVDKIFCIFYGREEEMGEEDPKPRKKSSLSSLFFSSLSLLTRRKIETEKKN